MHDEIMVPSCCPSSMLCLSEEIEEMMEEEREAPSPPGFPPVPGSACLSVCPEVCLGFPEMEMEEGDRRLDEHAMSLSLFSGMGNTAASLLSGRHEVCQVNGNKREWE